MLAAALIAAFFGFEIVSGRLEGFLARDESERFTRGLTVLLVLLAYLPTAQFYLARWTRRHVDSLRPLLRAGEELVFRDVYREASSRLAGAAGSVAFVVFFLLVPIDATVYGRGDYWTPENAVPWLLMPIAGWMVVRLAYALIFDALFVSRLAADLTEINLIDSRPLAPFVQQGLRSALLILLFLGIGLAGLAGQTQVMATALLNLAAMLAVALAALLLPVTGVRSRIRAEKQAQLTTLRARINRDRVAVMSGGPGTDSATSRLPPPRAGIPTRIGARVALRRTYAAAFRALRGTWPRLPARRRRRRADARRRTHLEEPISEILPSPVAGLG